MNSSQTDSTLGDLSGLKICIVGSGFFGAVIAERTAKDLKIPVLMLERRSHIGGNSWSWRDKDSGIDVHQYGSHIFHTSNKEIWDYLSNFCTFNNYTHRVKTVYKGTQYSMPVNLKTINQFFGLNLSENEAQLFIRQKICEAGITNPKNFEDKALSLIGSELYEAFFKGYSEKQWDTDLKKLPASIFTRLPVRFDDNDRYFNDSFEGIPADGYGALFYKMLQDPLITVKTGIDYFAVKDLIPPDCLTVYTGAIDQFFNYRHGLLGWRTLDLITEHLDTGNFQNAAIINYAEKSVPYTRIHEYRHLTPERKMSDSKTIIAREFPRLAVRGDDPYYPVNSEKDKLILEQYKKDAATLKNFIFGGRLASYKYMDMHQTIGAALLSFEKQVKPFLLK